MSARLFGYDPSRAFRQDFTKRAKFIVPIRGRETKPEPMGRRARPTFIECESLCVECDESFSRRIRVGTTPPDCCSPSCAQRRRWRVTGPSARIR